MIRCNEADTECTDTLGTKSDLLRKIDKSSTLSSPSECRILTRKFYMIDPLLLPVQCVLLESESIADAKKNPVAGGIAYRVSR